MNAKQVNKMVMKAQQAEMVSLMLSAFPRPLVESEIEAIGSLLASLTGDIAVFLLELQGETTA